MIRTQIQITERQVQQLKIVAAREKKSVAEVIREAIDLRLQRETGLDDATLRQRAIELAGKYHAGVEDLAEDHDRYLVEAFEE